MSGYDSDGYNSKGFDSKGYDKRGYDNEGYKENGFDKYGYNREGYDGAGFNKRGFNKYKWDKDGNNKSKEYIAEWECCGNPGHKDEHNPTPFRHIIEGKDRTPGQDVTCDEHNHGRCLDEPGGCKRMDGERERRKPKTGYYKPEEMGKDKTPTPDFRAALHRVNSSSGLRSNPGRGV